jgi:hypothetical protein
MDIHKEFIITSVMWFFTLSKSGFDGKMPELAKSGEADGEMMIAEKLARFSAIG